METLIRVQHTAHGSGFMTDRGSQLNVSAKGDVTTDGFLDWGLLQTIDPDPETSDLGLKHGGLWLHLSIPRTYVGAMRLMEIPDHLLGQATAAVNACRQRLSKRRDS